MTHASKDEIDGARLLDTVWRELHQVKALDVATTEHLNEVLVGASFNAEAMTKGLRAMFAFTTQWTQQYGALPEVIDLVRAERAGTLDALVAQLDHEWDERVSS